MKIAITGSTGFIGKNVLKLLRDKSVEIIVLSRKFEKQFIHKNISYIKHDFKKKHKLTFSDIGSPDILIHLAWSNLDNYNAQEHITEELPNHFNFLNNLIQTGLRNIMVTGTCFEYGIKHGEINENEHTDPVTIYGYAKDILHKNLLALKIAKNFNLTWTRLFYVFGKYQRSASIYSTFLNAIQNNDTKFPMSKGEQIRDYLHVETMAQYLINIAISKKKHDIINVCSGVPKSIRCLVEEWREKNNSSIELELGKYPYPDYEPFAFWGNSDRLKDISTRFKD